jgi:sulfite exporter TauE/SafE
MLTAPSWLDASLLATLGLMGLASVPHCALMCGAMYQHIKVPAGGRRSRSTPTSR